MKTLLLLLIAASARAELVPFPEGKVINNDQLIKELQAAPLGLVCVRLTTSTVLNCIPRPTGIELPDAAAPEDGNKKAPVADMASAAKAVADLIAAHIPKPFEPEKSMWEVAADIVNTPGTTRDQQIDAILEALKTPATKAADAAAAAKVAP